MQSKLLCEQHCDKETSLDLANCFGDDSCFVCHGRNQLAHSYEWMLPSDFLRQVVQLEELNAQDRGSRQLHCEFLAILGRDHEVQSLWDIEPQESNEPQSSPDAAVVKLVTWESELERLIENERLVMLMEHHVNSEHREWIDRSLETFKKAGFTHYAAEALGESGDSLARRGYPNRRTGYYASDPKFGNLLRSAISLQFQIVGYDFQHFSDHDAREIYATKRLAAIIANNPDSKMLVHAGHSHVFKHKTETGHRWLASYLWEESGVEPFTIWQISMATDQRIYRLFDKQLQDFGNFNEPVLMLDLPKAIDLPNGIELPDVDAILVHPPNCSTLPANRTVQYPDRYEMITGEVVGDTRPIVVSAYKLGEPVRAIPLDQILLREQETEFRLWIPKELNYEIRVFDTAGVIKSTTESRDDRISVSLKH